MSKKIILPADDIAASIQTVRGWVSRTGQFCGDNEELARHLGATHKLCGNPEHEMQPVYCVNTDEYYSSIEALFEHWIEKDSIKSCKAALMVWRRLALRLTR